MLKAFVCSVSGYGEGQVKDTKRVLRTIKSQGPNSSKATEFQMIVSVSEDRYIESISIFNKVKRKTRKTEEEKEVWSSSSEKYKCY